MGRARGNVNLISVFLFYRGTNSIYEAIGRSVIDPDLRFCLRVSAVQNLATVNIDENIAFVKHKPLRKYISRETARNSRAVFDTVVKSELFNFHLGHITRSNFVSCLIKYLRGCNLCKSLLLIYNREGKENKTAFTHLYRKVHECSCIDAHKHR